MRIYSGVVAALLLAAAAGAASAAGGVKYASPQAAFEQGLGAYKSGYYEIAVPALEEAAAKGPELNRFFAQFYLARIYSDNSGALTNHAKAYLLFQKLAEENVDADPDDGRRAPFVAKALTALASYLRQGVKAIGVHPDPERANEYLQHAATFFGDKDAQFELAKVYLSGSRTSEDVKRGMHYLSVLTEESYPGAQAYLADLLWRGRYVKKDERRALALITMAVENAPEHERIWIEDIYQNIYCGTSQGTRKQATGIVAMWRQMFARPAPPTRMELGGHELQPQRTCGDGEVVDIRRYEPAGAKEKSPEVGATPPAAARPEMMQGGAASLGFRDAGATK
jgi:exopolysaccharide production negative regulator